MFSIDNFYNYLNYYLLTHKKDTTIKSFNIHGSRLLKDIIIPSFSVDETKPWRLNGQACMFDQEPIEMEYFENWINFNPESFPKDFEYNATGDLYKNLTPQEFIFRHFSGVYNPILCHSERNSPDVKLFEQNHFIPVHYFYHGLIARDWFRHWIHYSMKAGQKSKRLGMYARDATGSRQYRMDLIHNLIAYRKDIYFELQKPILKIDPDLSNYFDVSTTEYDSNSSAIIVPEDCKKFDIQLVPETLFDTQKTHLTEKVFKPIVMEQPFIIVGCPNSLEYLKSYGFKTFDRYWDESYDSITDPSERMEAIKELVDHIINMGEQKYYDTIYGAHGIAIFNRQRFFSGVFEERMMEELHANLDNAIIERNKKAISVPGGTWFMYLDQLHQAGHNITEYNRKANQKILDYLNLYNPELAIAIETKYNDLLGRHR